MTKDQKNAEDDSIDSVDKAANTSPSSAPRAKARGPADKLGNGMKSELDPAPKPKTKTGVLSDMFDMLQNMDKTELDELYDVLTGEMEFVPESSVEIDYQEDLGNLMEDEATLSEEFKSKTAIIFEAAVNNKVATLKEELVEAASEEVEEFKAELVEHIDSYISYAAQEYLNENQLAVETGIRTEIAENFMEGLKDLFLESYIDVPESQINLVDELAERNDELEIRLNESLQNSLESSAELDEFKKAMIVLDEGYDLADTQIEKLKSLVEDVDFENAELFKQKVRTIKETYFKKENTKINESYFQMSDDVDGDNEDDNIVISDSMSRYVSVLKTQNKGN